MGGRSRRVLLLVVLGGTVAVLLLDRTWPADTSADTPKENAEAPKGSPAAVTSEPPPLPEATPGPREGTYGPQVPVAQAGPIKQLQRNPFEVIPEAFGWLSMIQQAEQHSPQLGRGDRTEELGPEEFAQRHRLQATCTRPHAAWAMIDGRLLTVGQKLDGYVLKAVESYQVVFRRGGVPATLVLPDNP